MRLPDRYAVLDPVAHGFCARYFAQGPLTLMQANPCEPDFAARILENRHDRPECIRVVAQMSVLPMLEVSARADPETAVVGRSKRQDSRGERFLTFGWGKRNETHPIET